MNTVLLAIGYNKLCTCRVLSMAITAQDPSMPVSLLWRHTGLDCVSNHHPHITQPFIQAQIKENTKVPRHWPLCGEVTGDRWIPRTHGQYHGKCFHLMTSSCLHLTVCCAFECHDSFINFTKTQSSAIYMNYYVFMSLCLSSISTFPWWSHQMKKKIQRYWHVCEGFTGDWWISFTRGQWRGTLMFSLICAGINAWVNNS